MTNNDSHGCLSRQWLMWLLVMTMTHVTACRDKLLLTWLLVATMIHDKSWLTWLLVTTVTNVTTCHDNDSRDCLSRQIITHVIACRDNDSWQIMTHAAACQDSDSRDWFSWQRLTWLLVTTYYYPRDCLSRQWLTTNHDSRGCLSRQWLTWLLIMTFWLAWLRITTLNHVTVVNSDIKTIELRCLTVIDRLRWHWRPSVCCRFSLALSVCVQEWRSDIRAVRGLRSKFWLIDCDHNISSADNVWHTVQCWLLTDVNP
jgi:hypothetical protein